MRKIINMGYYDNNYSGSEFNCISQPIAAIADSFCCGNYYYYAFYDTFFTNWATNENYYSLGLLEKSNLILLKLGLKMERHIISNTSSLLPKVKEFINNDMPVIVLLRRKTLIYAEGIPDSPHGVIVNGYADRNLAVGESGYASVMSSNNAIQGEPVELVYENGSVEKARITFDLNSSLVAAASSEKTAMSTPLERYHIFRFDEEYNLLYPVNTIEEGNSIYTESDKLGTYCVMDLVEWDKSLKDEPQSAPMMANFSAPSADISIEDDILLPVPSVSQESLTEEEQQAKIAEMEKRIQLTMDELLASENQPRRGRAATDERKKMDFVVAIDSTGSMKVSLDSIGDHYVFSTGSQARYFVMKLLISLNRKDIDWRMCLMDYRLYPNDDARTIYKAPDGSDWFSNSADASAALLEIENKTKLAKETSQTPWDALGYAVKELKFREGAVRHSVLLTDQSYNSDNRYGIKGIVEMRDSLEANGIYAHHLTPVLELYYYYVLRLTGGRFWCFSDDFIPYFPQEVVDDILAKPMKAVPEDTTDAKVITSYGLETIDTSNLLGQHLFEDLDGDGLDNMSEINMSVLVNANSIRDLITLKELSEKIDRSTIDGFTKDVLAKYASLLVLPLKSDPRKKDSDGDSYTYRGESYDYSDKNDPTPLRKDVTIAKLNNSDEFVKIKGVKNDLYYGGDQSWFGEGSIGESAGCGTVAAANIFAYLAGQNPERYAGLYNGDPKNITQNDFTMHMDTLNFIIKPININSIGLGIWPLSLFEKQIQQYCSTSSNIASLMSKGLEKIYVPAPIPGGTNSYRNSVLDLISTALSKDKPMALLIGLNSGVGNIGSPSPNDTIPVKKINRHWVTITEMRDDRIASISDVKISTWGRAEYANLNDIINGESLYNCFVYFE